MPTATATETETRTEVRVCTNHRTEKAHHECTKCRAPLCALCVYGDDANAYYCRPCNVARRRPGFFPSGNDGIVTIVLFVLALPVAAPGLLFTYLTAKRWGRLDIGHWMGAQLAGMVFGWVVMVHGFEVSPATTVWVLVVSGIAGLVFFIREMAKGRYPVK